MLGFCVPMSSWSPTTKIREQGLSITLENPGTETGLSNVFKGERNISGISDSREKRQLKDLFAGAVERWRKNEE